jgi:hypothetical protein
VSDAKIRGLERESLSGDTQAETRLRLAQIRAGLAPVDPSLMTPLAALEHLICEGEDAEAARRKVRELHGLARLPAGSGDVVKRAVRVRRRRALEQARRVPLTHRSPCSAREAIQSLLDRCNGQRRKRTVSLEQCLSDLRDAAARDEFVDEGRADHVANAYGYQSYQTATTVIRVGTRVLFWARECSASKGTRTTPWDRVGGDAERESACNLASTAPVVLSVALARRLHEVGA